MSPKSIESLVACWRSLLAAGIIIIAALLAYHNSFSGPFIFDDKASIVENQTIRQLVSIKEVLSPPAQGQAVQRRPIVNLSLAINYWLAELKVTGYHIFNLSIHILSALTLFSVVRRTLKLPIVSERLSGPSTGLALVITLIWTVHPLGTEAVTYIIQRTELLAGLFYLLTLYCVIRANSSARSTFWYATAVITCTLGMGSKEVMISAPLVILLYDRVFLSRSFKDLFHRRWALYVGLAATWALLVALIPHGHEGSAVFGRGSISLDYASTQFEVIANYLRLCFWPTPLILDYGIYKSAPFLQLLPYAIFIALLLLATILALRYKPWLGFLGIWFFAILAPSSSFVPLLGQVSAEKRMYLPLLAIITIVVLGGYTLGKRTLAWLMSSDSYRKMLGNVIGYSLAVAVIVILSLLSIQRNADYRTELSIWQDTLVKRPDNERAWNNRGLAHARNGKFNKAIADFTQAIRLDQKYTKAHDNRGLAHLNMGQFDKAIADHSQAIRLDLKFAKAYNNRGIAYGSKGEYDQAIRNFSTAVDLDPKYIKAYCNLGLAFASKGEYDQAIHNFTRAIDLNPNYTKAHNDRGLAYASKGEYDLAVRDFEKAVQLARDAGKEKLAKDLQSQLELYNTQRSHPQPSSHEGLSSPQLK